MKEKLREEIDVSDTKDKIIWNIPGLITKWPGTAFIAGSSGSGKGFWICNTILRHWRAVGAFNRRHVFYITPELQEDVTLGIIRDVEKYEYFFHGIDVSFQAFEDSGQSREQFFLERVRNVVRDQKDALIILDDFQDSAIPSHLRRYGDRLLRTGRHSGLSTWMVQHSLRNSSFSRQAVQSCKHIILFARSQRGKVQDFLKDSVGMSLSVAKDLTKTMAKSGRSAILRMHSPMAVVTETFVKLL